MSSSNVPQYLTVMLQKSPSLTSNTRSSSHCASSQLTCTQQGIIWRSLACLAFSVQYAYLENQMTTLITT